MDECKFFLQCFKQSLSLMLSQHFSAWSASQMRVWFKAWDLASARHA